MTGTRALFVALYVAVLPSGCGGEPRKTALDGRAPAAAPTAAERYFPLEDGKIYHYVTRERGETGSDTGMLVAKVRRVDATHGELRLSNDTKRFSYVPDGVSYQGGPYLLKTPLDVGGSWPGEHGGVTAIASVDASVAVPAGHYAACLLTVEKDGRPAGSRYETTYCPGIGMVLLVVTAGGQEARAELKSYGMPMKIE